MSTEAMIDDFALSQLKSKCLLLFSINYSKVLLLNIRLYFL